MRSSVLSKATTSSAPLAKPYASVPQPHPRSSTRDFADMGSKNFQPARPDPMMYSPNLGGSCLLRK